jgi:hypothetical protein
MGYLSNTMSQTKMYTLLTMKHDKSLEPGTYPLKSNLERSRGALTAVVMFWECFAISSQTQRTTLLAVRR